MIIRWNGTGAAWATYYGNSSALLETGGHRLLVDCGHSVPGRLREMGVSLSEIDAVLISHLHGDHVYGLEEWGFRGLLQWKKRPRLLIARDLAAVLWDGVLSGTMSQLSGAPCELTNYFDITVLDERTPFAMGPWSIEICRVRHVPNAPAYGLKIRDVGAAVALTADTLAGVDPWFYEDTAAVFHDCSFTPYYPETVHAHFEQLRQYPEPFRARTYLVHYEDEVCGALSDPAWRAELEASGMRLAEPFRAYTF